MLWKLWEIGILKDYITAKIDLAFRCISDNPVKHDNGPMQGEYCYPEFEIPLKEVRRVFIVTRVIKRNANAEIIE